MRMRMRSFVSESAEKRDEEIIFSRDSRTISLGPKYNYLWLLDLAFFVVAMVLKKVGRWFVCSNVNKTTTTAAISGEEVSSLFFDLRVPTVF